MAKEFKLKIVIDASAGGAVKGLGGVNKALQGLGKAAAGMGKTMTAGLGVASVALTKLAIDAAPLEGIEAAFEGLAASSGKSAKEMLAALQKGSSGMIAQRDLMRSYNEAAGLVSVTFANQLPQAMKYLSKVSAATGKDMGYMLDSLVRGVGRLSPLILDNLNVQVDLAAANEAYAASIGKTVDQLTKGEQQTALMSQVMEKLAENTAHLPEVAGSAATSMAALGAKVQNLKDAIGRAFLPVLEALLKPLAELADRYGPVIVEWVQKAANLFTALPQPLQLVVAGIAALAAVITGAMVVAGPLIGILGGVVGALGSLAAPLGIAIALIAALAAAWTTDFAGIRSTTMRVIGFITPFIQEMLGKVVSWVRENWPLIQETISTVLAAVQAVVEAVLSVVAAFWEAHGETITRIASLAWENIKTVISAALDILLGILKLAMQIITGDWQGAWQTILGISDTINRAILALIQNCLDMVLALFGTSLAKLVSTVQIKFEEAKAIVVNVMDRIVDFLSGIDLSEIGAAIMESLKSGILSKVQSIIDVVKRAIQDIIGAAKSALNMFSPSGVFVKMGKGISLGLAEGIQLGADLPMRATRGMIGDVVGAGRVDSRTFENHYHLTVLTHEPKGSVITGFETLKALA